MNRIFSGVFEDKKFYKRLIVVSLPLIVQNLISSALNLVDTMMIGAVGEKELAAVGIANQYFFLYTIFLFGLFSGSTVFISQFWGKKDIDNIKRVVGFGLAIGLALGIIFTVIGYVFPRGIISIFNTDPEVIDLGVDYFKIILISYIITAVSFALAFSSRGIEKTTVPMMASVIALLTNTALNYTLIYGHFGFSAMSVKGAAIATVIARVIECAILIGYIYGSKSVLIIKLHHVVKIKKQFAAKVFKVVVPVFLNEACWGMATVIYSIIYGRLGTQSMAAVQINSTVQNLFLVATFGIGNATMVMVGKSIGAGRDEEGKLYAKRLLVVGLLMAIVLSSAMALLAKTIVNFYEVSDVVKNYALAMQYIAAVVFIPKVCNVMFLVGIFRGGGDTDYAFKVEASTMWLIGVPLSLIGAFIFKLPVYVVFSFTCVEEVIKAIISFRRYFSNKWIKNVVNNMDEAVS